MRYQGRLTDWNDERGYGFITPFDGDKRVFVHVTAFSNRKRRPVAGQAVSYGLSVGRDGRTSAVEVAVIGRRYRTAEAFLAPPPTGIIRLMVAGCFLAVVAALVLTGRLPTLVLGAYGGASAVAFLAYVTDKTAARNGRWRTQESTLHMLGLAGGWPGALAAQALVRHKTRKREFQAVFWLTVMVNVAALGWLLRSL